MLQVRLLGKYEARLKDRPIDLSSRPAQSLLAYLLLNPNQPIRREKLAGLIWPASTESNARGNLRHALWRVRKSLDSHGDAYLHADDLTISLQLKKDDWVDVNTLDAHIQEDISTDALIEILSVYEGELLPGFYEDWVAAERERLKTVFEGKMDVLLDRLVAESRWEDAIEWGERWISLGFTPEHAFRAIMIAHARLGDLGKAAAVYQRCVLALESDLGVQPSRQTREIYQGLMAGTLRDVLPLARNKLAPRGYKLLEQIGAGSFGAVYRAHHPEVGREVAIKVILPQYANDPDFIRRFETEAQTVARLEHPHIVPLYDYWREPDSAYLVMRYLRGGSLDSILENGPLDFESVLTLVDQLAAALGAAHREGIVHRDIKPGNILLDESGNYYLSDFGIAKDISVNPRASSTGGIKGSPFYMSPEQLLGGQVTPRSDIYSLGLVLYQTLTGQRPYPGHSIAALIERQLHQPLPLVTGLRPEIPEEIDQVLQLATAKQPDRRFQDVVEVVEAFQAALSGKSLAFRPTSSPDSSIENPYKGLRSFEEADAEDFFGRDAMVQRLLARLNSIQDPASRNGSAPAEGRFLAVVGPSGSGKSSLVKAGLIPALRRGGLPGSENWFVIDLIPGAHPMEELEAALLRVAVNPPESLLGQLNEDERGLLRAVRRILPSDQTIELVLVIDQFEELFTLVAEEERRARFLDSLVAAVLDPRTRLRVIITLRADFTGQPLQYLGFGELFGQGTVFVLPMSLDELEQVIVKPAKRGGLILEPGLVERIISEVSDQPGTLPLLQHALSELFERREGRRLTLAAYEASGGVLGALGQRAEELYSSLDERGQELTRQVFLRLVTLGDGAGDGSTSPDTRRRVLRGELEALADPGGDQKSILAGVLDAFGRYRLLTFDRDPVTRGPTVEVAHEALLREWYRLSQWLDAGRNDIRTQRLLGVAAEEWVQAGRDPGFLLGGSRLDLFSGWAEETSILLTAEEQAFLDASLRARRERQAAEEARRQRELETAREAEEQARLATARELAMAADFNLEADPERSILLALQALQTVYTKQAEEALHRALQTSRILLALPAHNGGVDNLAYSPDGLCLATAGQDGTVKLWDSCTGELLWTLPFSGRVQLYQTFPLLGFDSTGQRLALLSFNEDRPQVTLFTWLVGSGELIGQTSLPVSLDELDYLAVSPDWSILAIGFENGTAQLWDFEGKRKLLALTGHDHWIKKIRYGSDGSLLATASHDGKVIVWDIPSSLAAGKGIPFGTFTAHMKGYLDEIAFDSHGTRVALGSVDGQIEVWDLGDLGAPRLSLNGHHNTIFDLAFSPDEYSLASSSADGTAKVWDLATGKELFTLAGHQAAIPGVSFDPSGDRLATASVDGTARIWNARPQAPGERLTLGANLGVIFDVELSPDDRWLALGDASGSASLWDAQTGQLLMTFPGEAGTGVYRTSFSPDGSRLATVGADNIIRIWDLETGKTLLAFTGHGEGLSGGLFVGTIDVSYSPDGTRLATAGTDGTAKVWDASTGEQLLSLPKQSAGLHSLAYSPDGCFIAISIDEPDSSVKVWDAQTGQEIYTLTGHRVRAWGLAFSPDSTRLATGGFAGVVKVWDMATGKELYTLPGQVNNVGDLAFSPDGKLLITAGETTRVWDAQTGAELLTLAPAAWRMDISRDGSRLYLGSFQTDVIGVYNVRLEDTVALARSRLTRWFTQEECQRFLHTDTCPPPP